jgi:hypothetical protein
MPNSREEILDELIDFALSTSLAADGLFNNERVVLLNVTRLLLKVNRQGRPAYTFSTVILNERQTKSMTMQWNASYIYISSTIELLKSRLIILQNQRAHIIACPKA